MENDFTDVIWAAKHLKSPEIRLLFENLDQARNKNNDIGLVLSAFCEENDW